VLNWCVTLDVMANPAAAVVFLAADIRWRFEASWFEWQ